MARDNIWVGKPKGSQMMFVYDKEVKHEDPSRVYLFSIHSGTMKEYKKKFVRSVLETVNTPDRDLAISSYLQWHDEKGTNFLESVREKVLYEMKQRSGELEKQKRRAILKHKEFIEKLGLNYEGVQPFETTQHRVTHCYSCKNRIDSEINIQCGSCGWLVCSCGACGCGYQGD